MNEKLMNQFGLQKGQRVLYPHSNGNNYGAPIYIEIVTVKDVVENYNDEIVLLIEEREGYLDLTDIYTKECINKLFE